MGVNSQNISSVRQEIEAALAIIGQKYGAKLAIGRIGYDSQGFSCKLTSVNIGANYNATPVQVPTNLRDLIGRRFKVRNTVYSVYAINDKPKYNIEARTQRGKIWFLDLPFIQSGVEVK